MARLEPKFLLRYPNKNAPSEIRLRLNFEYGRFIYPLCDPITLKVYKILPQLWDKANQKPIANRDIPKRLKEHTANSASINSLIEKIKLSVSEILEFARVNEINIDNGFLREQLDIRIGKREKIMVEELTVCNFYETTINEMVAGTLLTDSKVQYENGTIKSHRRTLLLLREFDHIKNSNTKFENIDNIWYDSFVQYLTFEYEDTDNGFYKEDYAPATVGKHIKNLKMIMTLAINKKVSTNREHEQKYFTKPKGDSFAVYLNEEEIKKIYMVKLDGENAVYDKYRDMFLIGCYTALRISDYTNIQPENFKTTAKGTHIIEAVTQKTKTRVHVPILYDEIYAIAQKYNYNFPKVSTQKLNDSIKIISKMAGITELITYKKTKGGETTTVTEPKYNLISSHTGRRSAATNLYNIYNIPEMNIMLITGHKTTENFRRYIKISGEENADKVVKQVNEKRNGKNTDNK